jgi:hypothetical protein
MREGAVGRWRADAVVVRAAGGVRGWFRARMRIKASEGLERLHRIVELSVQVNRESLGSRSSDDPSPVKRGLQA